MEMFTPSLDWGNEVVASLIWVAKAWVISAVVMLVVLALLARFTTLGPAVLAHHRRRISLGDRAFRCGRWSACCCCR